ncbi:MAG: putative glycoside hydrolase [Chloroflexia bacterium]
MARRQRYFSDYGRPVGGREHGPQILPYLLIAVAAIIGLMLAHTAPPGMAIHFGGRVVDAYTGQALPGANLLVLAAGPERPAVPAGGGVAVVGTTPVTVAGVSTTTQALAGPAAVFTTTTGPDGSFNLTNPPSDGSLLVEQHGYAPQQVSLSTSSGSDIRLVPDTLQGSVADSDGHPVSGATVVVGQQMTTTDSNGAYNLSGVGSHKLIVKAPGYEVVHTDFGNVTRRNVTLKPFAARAIYVSGDTLKPNAQAKFFDLIKLAHDTEINAMVIDVKADTTGYVLYKTSLPQVLDVGASDPVIGDLHDLVAMLHKNGIYVIARQALFWDEKLAAAHPEWAIRSKATGGPWADAYGHHWVNPYRTEVWDYNIAIADEVASLGVDEVQFDYVRFPSDGNLSDTDYGVPDSQAAAGAISGFLARAQKTLSLRGAFISADVFGLSPIVSGDLGIGQQFDQLIPHLDYVSPMAYPSHYSRGFLNFDKPAEHPSEIVGYTLQEAQKKMARSDARIRPWLQDFTLDGTVYDASRVRGEIDTSEADGTDGWMLWNYDNVYTQDALKKGK